MKITIERAKSEHFRIDRDYNADTKSYFYIIEPREPKFRIDNIDDLIKELQSIKNILLFAMGDKNVRKK